jgi:molybdopterin-guanine dinucleotide biosynthesis protein A
VLQTGSSECVTDVTGVVLAGGQSRRMGRDKALLELSGETLLERTVHLLSSICGEVLVIGRDASSPATSGACALPDDQPGLGPLGGIATALRALRTERAFFVACDMPLLQPDLIRYLISLTGEADAVVPRSAYGPQPLHAVYSVACLPAAESCLAEGECAVSTMLARVPTRIVAPDEWLPYDPHGLSFLSANTPDEWQTILARISASIG